MSTPKRKHQSISIETKKQIIDALATKSYGQLAKNFNLPKSTVATIVKSKDRVLAAIDNGTGAKRACLKPAKNEDLMSAHY